MYTLHNNEWLHWNKFGTKTAGTPLDQSPLRINPPGTLKEEKEEEKRNEEKEGRGIKVGKS